MQSLNVGWFSRLANALRPLVTGAYEQENALEVLGVARPYLLRGRAPASPARARSTSAP